MRERFFTAAMVLAFALAGPAEPGEVTQCPENDSELKLPPGFCATVFADGLGHVRHIAVSPNGVVYANTWSGFYYGNDTPPAGGFLLALKDTAGKGKADAIERFGETAHTGAAGGTGIAVYKDFLYAEINDRIVRYRLPANSSVPQDPPEVVVSGLPLGGDHPMHPFAIGPDGMLYVDIASITNSCQERNRQLKSPGLTPCKELETRSGIWRFDANKTNQKFSAAERFATGIRNAGGIAADAGGAIFATQHGRDQLSQNWPALYTSEQSAVLPAEELLRIEKGGVYGWPECYFDPMQGKRVLAPEYGGDGGKAVGKCADKPAPVAAFPAHWAPNALLFYQGGNFPARYRDGAFIAFHGSWNRAPLQQAGYNVVFQPLKDGKVSGRCEIFAEGFAGAVKAPDKARHRPAGLAVAPDGTLYVSDDVTGRIYRVTYQGRVTGRDGADRQPSSVTYCPHPAEYGRPTADAGLPLPQGSTLPQGVSLESVAEGRKLYTAQSVATTCSGCHGSDGTGTTLGPNLTDTQVLWGDGSFASIQRIIAEGIPQPKNYRSPMPARGGSQLTDSQLRSLAAYTWALGQKARKPLADLAIPGGKTFPESITSLVDGTIIVGSLGEGPLYMAAPGAASAGYFIAPGTDGLQKLLGILADESSSTLWVCSIPAPGAKNAPPSSLFAFDLKSGRARAQYPLPTPGALCNDIATAANGDVYATDTVNMEILRLPRGGSTLDIWAGGGAFGPKGGVLDGIAVVADSVLVNTLNTGKLFRVAIAADGVAGRISEIDVGRTLEGPDGMRRFGENSVLLVESGGPGRLVRVDLDGDTGRLTTLREGFPGGPVSVTVVGDTAYVLEGQLTLRHQKPGDPKPRPFKAIAVPIGKSAQGT